MGNNPYSIYTGKSSKPASHSGHGGLLGEVLGKSAGLVTHLGSDIKDAAFGLPTGVVQMVEHPVKSGKEMGLATWHDWSPLIHGHPGEWAHNTYEHPLGPLLDLATVFSLGAGAYAKAGQAAVDAGLGGKVAQAAADLGKASRVKVLDQSRILKGEVPRDPLVKTYSASAGANLRRAATNKALQVLESHGRVPQAFTAAEREGRLYNRLHYIDLAHRHAAMNYTIDRLMKAGQMAGDVNHADIVQPHVLSQNYWSMRKFAVHHDINQPIPSDYVAVKEMTDPAMFNPVKDAKGNVIPLSSRLRDFANSDKKGVSFTTSSVKDAAKVDGGKNILIVPKHTMKALGIEGAESAKALHRFAHDPVTWWKRIQVGYAPRVVVNNTMGNWIMYAMRTAGAGGGRAVVDAVRHTWGERHAMQAFKSMHDHILKTQGPEAAAHFTVLAHPDMIDAPNISAIEKTFGKRAAAAVTKSPDWVDKYFKTEMGSTFGNVLTDTAKKDAQGNIVMDPLRTKESKLIKSGFYPLVHKIADRPVRIAALYQYLRRSPEVKGYLSTHPGVKLDDAINKVLSKNEGLRKSAEEHVRSIAGDYSTLGPRERTIQNIVPFYLWDKHIVKHVANMFNERPGTLNATAKLGQQGTQEEQKLLGDLPEFMQGALPLSLLGGPKGSNGRTNLLMTTGLNPYHTVGDLAQMATALATRHDATAGADAANNLSPVITGLIESISGHKIGTQAPTPAHGGVIPSVAANMLGGTSYGTLLGQLIHNTHADVSPKTGKPYLYSKSPAISASGLFGLPVREASLERAHVMAAQEKGKKSKKRRNRTMRSARG